MISKSVNKLRKTTTKASLRLLIDTTYRLRAPFSGTGIYIERLCDALRIGGEVEVIEAANHRRRAPAGGGVGSIRNLLTDWRWTQRELPRRAAEIGADVIHHSLPAHSRGAAVPQVITVHDLAFEHLADHFDPRFRRYARFAHRRSATETDAVICVSQATARDVRELWGIPEERIVVAPHGPGQDLTLAHPGQPRHFLYVGDDEPRKNLGLLLSAYRRYRETADSPLPLVLTGQLDRSGPGIAVERNPSRGRLAELYGGAVALVHPSLYEGFGLTALEAMSLGTPVIAARIPALLEVCGEAAEYVTPAEPLHLAAVMSRIASEPELRAELAARGRRRAEEFSWSRSAAAHVTAYSLALGQTEL